MPVNEWSARDELGGKGEECVWSIHLRYMRLMCGTTQLMKGDTLD